MNYFPINLNISRRHCIIIGGGRVAARKVKSLLENQGKVTVISPELNDELVRLAEKNEIQWLNRGYRKGDLARAFLVIAATDDVQIQEAVYQEAEEQNLLVNVADVPKWCNFILPATVRRGDLTVSVSTAGKSPALAKQLRKSLEKTFTDDYELLLRILGNLRPIVMDMGHAHEKNKIIFENLLHKDMITWLRRGDMPAIQAHIKSVLGRDIDINDIIREKAQ